MTRNVERITVDQGGSDPNASSTDPSVSADGRFVAFLSEATDLVPGDDNGVADVYVRDRQRAETIRVTVAADGTDSNGVSQEPRISANGRYVVFASLSTNLLEASEGVSGGFGFQVFVRDLARERTHLVSVNVSGGYGQGDSSQPSVSRNGRYIAFTSIAGDLVPDDGTGPTDSSDVFVRDMKSSTTTRVSVSAEGGDPDRSSSQPSISDNGLAVGGVGPPF